MSDLLSAIPLVLEVSCLGVPFVNFIRDSVEGHDPFHEQGRDSGSEETDQDVVVRDASLGSVTLKCRDIALERRGVLPIILSHVMGGQPRDGVSGSVLVFEHCLELLKKVVPRSKGNSSAVDGVLPEGVSPGQGRPFSHIREGEGDLLCVVVAGCLVDCEIKLDGVHPGDSCFVGAIEGFGFAELELSRFGGG